MKEKNKDVIKAYTFYRVLFFGFLIQAVVFLAKIIGIFDFSWKYVFLPIGITYAIILLPLILILFKVLYDNLKNNIRKNF